MKCPSCGGDLCQRKVKAAGDCGVRRNYVCRECARKVQTLEVVVPPTRGRDAAKRQAAAILGTRYEPSKNLHTLRAEVHAESAEFKWAVLDTYPCTFTRLANKLGLQTSATQKRLRHLEKLGIVRSEEVVLPGGSRVRHHAFLPSHKRAVQCGTTT